MTHDSTQFDLDLDAEFGGFDPLEDREPEDDGQDGSEFSGYVGSPDNQPEVNKPADDRPAQERIADLFAAMAPRRRTLLGILSFCAEPRPVSRVNELVDQMQENNFSVYTAANLCALLEKAGALVRVDASGESMEDLQAKPQIIVIDGIEYLEAQEAPEIHWLSTEEGNTVVAEDRPLDRLKALFEEDNLYQPIYQQILALCAAEGGTTMPDIGAAVDSDPLLQKPRFYASHFIDKLEKCDAVVWRKTWGITEIGQAGLETLTGATAKPSAKSESNNAEHDKAPTTDTTEEY